MTDKKDGGSWTFASGHKLTFTGPKDEPYRGSLYSERMLRAMADIDLAMLGATDEGDRVLRAKIGWVPELPEPEPAYDELGYPETEARLCINAHDMDIVVDIWAGGPVWSILEEMVVVIPTDKELPIRDEKRVDE